MSTQTKTEINASDLKAVREFLLTGREMPATQFAKPVRKASCVVPFHVGITRARGRQAAKA